MFAADKESKIINSKVFGPADKLVVQERKQQLQKMLDAEVFEKKRLAESDKQKRNNAKIELKRQKEET